MAEHLEDILAAIEAEGHELISLNRHDGKWFFDSCSGSSWSNCKPSSSMAVGVDPLSVARVRLAAIGHQRETGDRS